MNTSIKDTECYIHRAYKTGKNYTWIPVADSNAIESEQKNKLTKSTYCYTCHNTIESHNIIIYKIVCVNLVLVVCNNCVISSSIDKFLTKKIKDIIIADLNMNSTYKY